MSASTWSVKPAPGTAAIDLDSGPLLSKAPGQLLGVFLFLGGPLCRGRFHIIGGRIVPSTCRECGMPQRLRIFISSPGDVPDERLRADLVIDRLAQDYSRFFTIDGYRWEHEPMLASGHFQDAVEPPSTFDIVVMILWSRLGTPLPDHTGTRAYRGIDNRAPVTGTEWEYEEALQAARSRGAPDILAFRN